jgi:hypothetical protein
MLPSRTLLGQPADSAIGQGRFLYWGYGVERGASQAGRHPLENLDDARPISLDRSGSGPSLAGLPGRSARQGLDF